METLALTVTTTPVDPVPEDDDVVAGPWGAVMFAFLIIATALLMWSFTRQLRKAQRAKDAGVYGDPPADRTSGDGPELSGAELSDVELSDAELSDAKLSDADADTASSDAGDGGGD